MGKVYWIVRQRLLSSKLLPKLALLSRVHHDVPVHLVRTEGGLDISQVSYFPIYQKYLDGHYEEASSAYRAWYLERLEKDNTDHKGDEHFGPMWKLIERKYLEKNIDFHHNIFLCPDIVTEAIQEIIDERFKLIESIKAYGFIPNPFHPLTGFKKGRNIHLTNGYHRSVILRLLGYATVPEIRVRLLGNMDDNPLYPVIRKLLNR